MSNQQNIEQFFHAFQQKIEQAQQRLPDIIGTEVLNSALDNFRDESFFGDKWPARKDKKNTRKLLVKTGALQRSPRVIRSQPGLVTVGSDVPYASVHNNGEEISRNARSETFIRNRHTKGKKKGLFSRGITRGQGFSFKAYTYSMPRRRFFGAHPKLKEHLQQIIKEEFQNALKGI
ncbi:phage virion morphogenesis protein [Sphingobacterium psychroaquaticum]|uniref:Phage virion morphogenesis family protein n=1 Tax=Sphingobacterium psychroaquaticum TaxID=561061 RepID=A0A1X7K3Z9_9SPHI|nr:phage virion morphogenesis protein [Sphingobacterium psychroaquaticum]SMG35597.1 Phage virion morphogenesis family protein [Sphingobacterium psychroaquaticum]